MQNITQQKGAVLIMALVLLTILMFIALSFSRITTLDIRSAKNYGDNALMLLTLENILLAAEENIESIVDPIKLVDKSGQEKAEFHQISPPSKRLDPFDKKTWLSNNNIVTVTTELGTGAYYVERVDVIAGEISNNNVTSVSLGGYAEDATPPPPDITIFRSVVRVKNSRNTGFFMIESFYGKVF